jgi:hypothetical protein
MGARKPTKPTGDIAWTPADRALVYPSRRVENPGYLAGLLAHISSKQTYTLPLDVDVWRGEVRYWWGAEKRTVERVVAGAANNPGPWRRIVDEVIARCTAAPPGDELDVDVEAAMVALEISPLYAAMPYWLAAGGVLFALRALARCHQLDSYARTHGYGAAGTWLVEVDYTSRDDSAWQWLRGMLATAIAPVYDECHGIADALRQHAHPFFAGLLAFAFPDEQSWADDAAPGIIDRASAVPRGYTPAIARFLAVASLDDACALLACTTNEAIDRADLVTALAHHGPAGVRVIEAAIDAATNDAQRRMWCHVLLMVRTPEAGRIFAKLARRAPHRGGKTFGVFARKFAKL